MSDDLVKRLRTPWDADRSIISQTDNWMMERQEAADRIEELEAQLNLAQRQVVAAEFNLATCKKYRDTYAECDRIGTQAVRELEAKLAEAMKALNDIARQKKTDELETEYDVEVADFEGGYDMCIDLARTTLAEITGGNDE